MSISLDASQSKWDFNELSMSRSNNPFTSSANLGASLGSASGFGQQNVSRSGYPVQQPQHHFPSNFAPPAASSVHNQGYASNQIRPTNHGMQHAPIHSNNGMANRRPLAATKPNYGSRSRDDDDDYDQDGFEDADPYDHEQDLKMAADSRAHKGNQRYDTKSSRK